MPQKDPLHYEFFRANSLHGLCWGLEHQKYKGSKKAIAPKKLKTWRIVRARLGYRP